MINILSFDRHSEAFPLLIYKDDYQKFCSAGKVQSLFGWIDISGVGGYPLT